MAEFYIGSCQNLEKRLIEHLSGIFYDAFTKGAKEWIIYFKISLSPAHINATESVRNL